MGLYKDHCNRKSNQKNLGTIKGSNLCTEIIEFSSFEETAVCNLGSIALPKFVRDKEKSDTKETLYGSIEGKTRIFDFDKLEAITQQLCLNLNRIIDINSYPIYTAKYSNLKNRPIGIGVQGLADTFVLLDMPFESEDAKNLNKDIFECMYFSALKASCNLAKLYGSYSSYAGSPVSMGILQQDMWDNPRTSQKFDWKTLREEISRFGVRNSLLIAPMPTATTSQILGFNECIEPYTNNVYVRRVLSGEFVVVNQHLLV